MNIFHDFIVRQRLKKIGKSILSQTVYRYDPGDRIGINLIEKGIWFTPDMELAKSYIRDRVDTHIIPSKFYQTKLRKLKNFLVVDCLNNHYRVVNPESCLLSGKIEPAFGTTDSLASQTKTAGYDAVIFINVKENDRQISSCSICVFNATVYLEHLKDISDQIEDISIKRSVLYK